MPPACVDQTGVSYVSWRSPRGTATSARANCHLAQRATPTTVDAALGPAQSRNAEPLLNSRYLSALNSSVRRLIFEAAPPMIHRSYTTTAIVIAARMRLTDDTCQKPTK